MVTIKALPPEIISYIMRFLSISDRKEASLVCRSWYHSSLDPRLQMNVIVKFKPPENGKFSAPLALIGRKLTHLAPGEWDSSAVSEEMLIEILTQCPNLLELDLSCCNALFLSGNLFSDEKKRKLLTESLRNVRDLKLCCLRHMTDITFSRIVSVAENVESISLASTYIIFGNGAFYCTARANNAMFHFSTFLNFLEQRCKKIRTVNLSHTAVNDEALEELASVKGLCMQEVILQGCAEISDRGIKILVSKQHSIKGLDISGCKEIGYNKSFFSTLTNNLPKLQSLNVKKCARLGQCDVQSLADLPSLQYLNISEVLNLFDHHVIKGLCTPGRGLTSVSLAYCPDIHDVTIISLCQMNTTLTHFDLTSCRQLTDASLHAITKNLGSLQSLSLAYCREISDLGLLGYITENGIIPRHSFDHDHDGCPCTRERESKIFRKPTGILKQYNSSISKAQNKMVSGEEMLMLSTLTFLDNLDLSYCSRITDIGLSEAIQFSGLRTLTLNKVPKMTDKAVQQIARNNPSLEKVSLKCCSNITDVAIGSLSKYCPSLANLDVSQCDLLTDECLKPLAVKSRRLRCLDISFCSGLTVEAIFSLESCFPLLKITFRPHSY